MAKLIKQIYDLVNLATDKGITGYHSDSQIMDAIHEGQMVLWRQLVKQFPKDKRVRNDLLPFEVRATITLTSGIGDIPTNYEHEIEGWVVTDSVKRRVTFVEEGFFMERILDPVDTPSTTNPFVNIYFDTARKIEIAPSTITSMTLVYFKKPIKPVFSTIESGGSYIYDDATSTDVEWSETLYDILIEKALLPLGLNMRDGQVQTVGRPVEPKEATL
jgi:hypothetical protein